MWIIYLRYSDKKYEEYQIFNKNIEMRNFILTYLLEFDFDYFSNIIKHCFNREEVFKNILDNNGFINDKVTCIITSSQDDNIQLINKISYKEMIDPCIVYTN